MLLSQAARHGVCLRLRPRVGEHVVVGTTLAWIWRAAPGDPAPDPQAFSRVLGAGVRIGFERTLQQDAAFGIRQLVDVACKALSPAVNDPYTAVQAVDHLSVIFCALARRASSSQTPSGKSASPPTLPSPAPKRSPCSRRWPRAGPARTRPAASRTSRPPPHRQGDTANTGIRRGTGRSATAANTSGRASGQHVPNRTMYVRPPTKPGRR